MWKFDGTINGIVTSQAKDLPMEVDYFLITAKQASVTCNVYMLDSVNNKQVCITPNPVTLAAGQSYEGTEPLCMLIGEQIKIQSSGQVDYIFTINNIQPDYPTSQL